MSSIPTYNIDENFRRISRQKGLAFIVVEGIDDVPIYESCLSYMLPDDAPYDVIHSGGKTAIRDFILNNKNTNTIFIIDRDFNDIGITDSRIVSLDRYSVENYFICEDVVSHSLQFALSCKFKDAVEFFNLDEYRDEIASSIETLIKVIFYYQRVVAPQSVGQERPKWSDAFLCENGSWHLCKNQIDKLIDELLPDPKLLDAAKTYYEQNFKLDGSIVDNFPGKILKHSLQRYIRHKVIQVKPNAKGKYNDVETTRALLSSVMHRSRPMSRVLTPVVAFIKTQMTA